MAATVWKGRITFGLVSVPVRMYASTQSHDIHFNYLHEKDMSRVHIRYHCDRNDEIVDRDELVRGYEHQKGQYVIVDDEELERIEPESSSTLEIRKFIDLAEVDPVYFERSYYLGPDEGTDKTYALLQKAMDNKNKAAVGKLFMRDREYLALIRPADGALVLETMHYHDEVRKNEYKPAKNGNVREKELALAENIIENLTEKWEPEEFENDYIQRLEDMLEAKVQGKKIKQFPQKQIRTIPNLMEALQASIRHTQRTEHAGSKTSTEEPLPKYDELSAEEILQELEGLPPKKRQQIAKYEKAHKKRKTVLEQLKRPA